MPNALKGSRFVAEHPELRAKDLMDAFRDPGIRGIFCAIGGDDTIRLLPYIDYEVIRNNPKIFMGYSDTTINHFMMYKAGLVSFYGPAVMSEFGEYVNMSDYTAEAVRKILFEDSAGYSIEHSPVWSNDWVDWNEESINIQRKMIADEHEYEILQGTGNVCGHLLGGCLDVFLMANGTEIWPAPDDWKGAVLFLETSEDQPSPIFVVWMLRNLAAQGILNAINGILIGKPCGGKYYEEYKDSVMQVVNREQGLTELPIFYNVNFGHAIPIGVIPYGIQTELDCSKRTITFLESATAE
jgi:muramoyltetrapeptide carboxypeptidase LdcA involved in peptidoglycan recycling